MGNVHMEATQINFRGGASKMNVEEAIKSAIELTPEQKTNINKIPTIEAAVATKTDQTVIAPEFDAESGTYAIGDMVMHDDKLYEFTTAHDTAGDWNPEEVSEKTVSDELDTLKSGLTNQETYSSTAVTIGSFDNHDYKRKLVNINSLPNNTSTSISAGLGSGAVTVNIYGCGYISHESIQLPYHNSTGSQFISLEYDRTNDTLDIATNFNASNYAAYIVIEYIQ